MRQGRTSNARTPDFVSGSARWGFTLLEVLIAVAILGVVLTAVYSTFFLAEKALSATDQRLVRLQEIRILLDTMKREIESAYLNDRDYTIFKVDDRDYYGRQGSQLEITCFAGPVPGLARMRYAVEERSGKLVLRKTVTSAYSAAPLPEPEDLLEDIYTFTVEVRSEDKWLRTWDSGLSRRLPEEVRISFGPGPTAARGIGTAKPPPVFSETARLRIGSRL